MHVNIILIYLIKLKRKLNRYDFEMEKLIEHLKKIYLLVFTTFQISYAVTLIFQYHLNFFFFSLLFFLVPAAHSINLFYLKKI